MIKFSCKCGKKYEVPENYAGKKVRCKKCDNMIRIPSIEKKGTSILTSDSIGFESEHSPSPEISYNNLANNSSASENSGIPKPLIFTFIGIGIIFAGFILYFSVFRDTWERDNLLKMSQMISEANQHYDYEEYNEGLNKYEELTAFVGDRELKREELSSDYSDVRNKYEAYKAKIRAEKERLANLARLKKARQKAEEEAKQKALAAVEDRERQRLLNRTALIDSFEQYNEALEDLKNGLDMGVNVGEFRKKTNVLMNAFSKIEITPEIEAFIKFKEFEKKTVPENLSKDKLDQIKNNYIKLAKKTSEIGDEQSYAIYMHAKHTKDFAVLVAQSWGNMVTSANSPMYYEFKANRDRNMGHLTNNIAYYDAAYSKMK